MFLFNIVNKLAQNRIRNIIERNEQITSHDQNSETDSSVYDAEIFTNEVFDRIDNKSYLSPCINNLPNPNNEQIINDRQRNFNNPNQYQQQRFTELRKSKSTRSFGQQPEPARFNNIIRQPEQTRFNNFLRQPPTESGNIYKFRRFNCKLIK
jgi:hypothetical protein